MFAKNTLCIVSPIDFVRHASLLRYGDLIGYKKEFSKYGIFLFRYPEPFELFIHKYEE